MTELLKKIFENDRKALAKAITLVESTLCKHKKEANNLIQPIEKKLQKIFKINLFTSDHKTLPSVVIDLSRKRGQTLSIAESCTGGSLAAAITTIPGSSDVFLGGVIAYNNKIKENILGVPPELIDKYGAVSKPVACPA